MISITVNNQNIDERRNTMTYGPVDFFALEFKTDQLAGDGMAALLKLVESRIIRIIDLVIILKDDDGTHAVLEIEELAVGDRVWRSSNPGQWTAGDV
jgi:hypothetical protein